MKKLISLILAVCVLAAPMAASSADIGDNTDVVDAAELQINIGDYIQMGKYNDAPILWRCMDINDEHGTLLLSDKILCAKAFDTAGIADTQPDRLVEQLVFDSDGKWISGSYEGFIETRFMNEEMNNLIDSTYWYISGKNIYEFSKNVRVTRRNDLFGMPASISLEELAYGFSSEEYPTFWCYRNPEDAFFDGLAKYWQGDRWTGVRMGYLDKTGALITPPIYDAADNFSEGLAAVGTYDGDILKYGYIDQTGKLVIPMIYDAADAFSNGLARVSKDGEWQYIDKSGEPVGPASDEISPDKTNPITRVKSTDLSVVSRDVGLYGVEKGPYGIVDSNGNTVLPMEYDRRIRILDDGYILAQKGNLCILFYDTWYSNITVKVNYTVLTLDVPPMLENDRTLVPMRAIFEALGAEVSWYPESRAIVAVRGDTTVFMQVDDWYMSVNDEWIALDAPPRIVNDRTLIPLRAVAEALGAQVGWDEEMQVVTVELD